MKIILDTPVSNLDGTPVQFNDKVFTIRDALIVSLGAGVNDDKSPQSVIKLYDLGVRILNAQVEVDITPVEATILQALISKSVASPMHSGQICKVLNG